MSKIKIETEVAISHIYIDGQEIHDVTFAEVLLRQNKIPELRMSIVMKGTFPGDSPIRSVDGKSVKCPLKYEYVLSDISKSDAGRTEDTVMHKGKVGQTISLNVGWESLTTAELSTLLKQFDKEYINLVYLDAKAGDFLTAEYM